MPAKKTAKKSTTKKKIKHSAKPAAAKGSAKKASSKAPARKKVAAGRAIVPRAVAARVAVERPAPSPAENFAIEAARCMGDDKCTDVVLLDVRGKNPMTDFLVIGSGTSDRQMRAVLHHIQDLGETLGYQAVRSTSDDRATWLLADFMNVIVHLFEPNTRAHYDLEMMWGDTARVEWERPGTLTRDRAGLNTRGTN
ncbi:MAG: ribosome silencing factor [Phycisphaerales bacterium]